MKTAWVLTGGAALAAVQAGQAAALVAAGLAPDLLVGASAGALNAAWLAADPSPPGVAHLAGLWTGVRRRDVLRPTPWSVGLGLAGRRDHLVPSARLGGWLEAHLPYRRIEEGRVPLTVTATDLDSGQPVFRSQGALIPALLASCALPGLLPPVVDGGRTLVDGGVVADAPIGHAVARGAERIFVLPTLAPRSSGRAGVADVVLRAVGLVLAASRAAGMDEWASCCEIFVLPVPAVPGASPLSLRHAAAMVDAGRDATAAWWRSARPLPAVRPGPAAPLEGRSARRG